MGMTWPDVATVAIVLGAMLAALAILVYGITHRH